MSGKPLWVAIGTTVAASDAIEVATEGFSSVSFQLSAASGTTQVTVYSQLGDLDWMIANDEANNSLVLAVTADRVRALPDCVAKLPRIKLVASAGAATADVPVFLASP